MFYSKTFVPVIVHSNIWTASQLKSMMSQPKRGEQGAAAKIQTSQRESDRIIVRPHKLQLNNFHSSANTIRLLKSRLGWDGKTCSMHSRKQKCTHSFHRKTYMKETTWKTEVQMEG